ncbi:C6 zinc finger domain protein [Coniochaeta hoffmannii]|uniref:C6 zinc finger domain protein n=1 Tax=Coniochaeta hoffmannii TaxID=91930 RepID=A0AA38VN48_9PEZI|nr:C6 zinc finger domain protein [Coniochaeta hoffmannii]
MSTGSGSGGGLPSPPKEGGREPKRPRTSKPKVKTGCNNCKQRRIKCDEKRPSCSNCIRSKKICTGYPPPSRSARANEVIAIAPKPLTSSAAAVHTQTLPVRQTMLAPSAKRLQKYHKRNAPSEAPLTPRTPFTNPVAMFIMPSSTLPFDATEGLYFQLFQEQTANELSGFFDNIFWSRGVLQECHSEAAIRHAVVALGALYKTLEKTCESPPSSPSNNHDPVDTPYKHWEMAVKKYSSAIQELFAYTQDDTRTHRTRLMASVLLACFDSFIGDHRQAIKQIQNGLGLLEQLRVQRRRAFLPKPEEPVEEELIQMFTRLAIQAKSYDMAFHFPHPYVIRLTGPPPGTTADASSPNSSESGSSPVSLHHEPIPERFHSSREARLIWDSLVERIFRFTETMFSYVSGQNGPTGVLPASLRTYGVGFKDQIQAWSDAYEHILASRTAPNISHQEKAAIAVLKMTQIMSQILFLMTFSDSEMQFDAFTGWFKAIVDLAAEVVGDEERRAAARRCPDPRFCSHPLDPWTEMFGKPEYAARHIKPSFSADLGIVPPLFVVATKCRDPDVRRQAISLLKSSSRREGMWDSELAARIGIWIAGIEEQEEEQPLAEAFSPYASSRPSTSSTSSAAPPRHPSVEFGDDVPLGPGGNARFDARRVSSVGNRFQQKKVVPAERRVMIKAIEFDLRDRRATIQLGSRDLPPGAPDLKTRSTQIVW